MSMFNTIPAMYAQTGYTARVVHEAVTTPQTAQSMARVMAVELMRQEQQQIQGIDKPDAARVADGGEQGGKHMPFGNRRRNRKEPPPEDTAPTPAEGPLIGNLLNIKV